MQDELAQLKAENALMKQTGLTKYLYLEVFDFCYILFM